MTNWNQMIHKRILGLVLLFYAIPTHAQNTTLPPAIHSFSLQDCISYAQEHQYALLNARMEQQKSREVVGEQRGKLLPHVDITGSFVDNLKLATSLIPDLTGDPNNKIPVQFGNKFTSSVFGQLNQTLFNSDYFLGLKASKVYQELSTKDLRRNEIDTKIAVTQAYYNVLVAEETINILTTNKLQLEKTLNDTKARYDVGVAERIDVDRIQVSYNTIETQVMNAQRLLDYSYYVLKFQMSMPETDSLELTEKVDDFANTLEIVDTVSYHYTDRVEYSIQETQIALNQLDLKSKKLGFLPSLNAYVNYGYNYFGSHFNELYKEGFGASAIGVNLTFPIFTGTERIHTINQAKLTVAQSQNDLAQLTQQIQLEVRQSFTDYRNNMQSYMMQKRNMELNQGIYERVELKFEQGVATSLDVISAESELKVSQGDYLNALLNALLSKVQLDKAMGKITSNP